MADTPNIEQAAAEITNLVRMFRGVRDAEVIIDTLRNAQQVEKETKAAIAKAQRELKGALQEVSSAQGEAARILDDAKFQRDAAVAERERILADARGEAERILLEANSKRTEADDAVASAKRELDAITQRAGILRGEVQRLEASRQAVLAALTGAQSSATDVPPAE